MTQTTSIAGGDGTRLATSLGRLAELPEDTLVLPGHDYAHIPVSTIGRERTDNPVVRHVLKTPSKLCPGKVAGAEGGGGYRLETILEGIRQGDMPMGMCPACRCPEPAKL